jgi:hypothetical protein
VRYAPAAEYCAALRGAPRLMCAIPAPNPNGSSGGGVVELAPRGRPTDEAGGLSPMGDCGAVEGARGGGTNGCGEWSNGVLPMYGFGVCPPAERARDFERRRESDIILLYTRDRAVFEGKVIRK